MKPIPFDYVCPESIDAALTVLAEHEDAKVIAGGQSLLPMLNFRVVRPSILVDIGELLELDRIDESEAGVCVGALTRHYTLKNSPLIQQYFPVITKAMSHVAHVAIRNRGTIGGSLSHADPAAELPMLSLLLNATMHVRSLRGERSIAAADFFVGSLTSALESDELLTHISFPFLPSGVGWEFEEVARRAGDFALASVAVVLEKSGGKVTQGRIAMMGIGETPIRCLEAETLLSGQQFDEDLIAAVVDVACSPLQPNQDLHASPEYRRHLAAVLTQRALRNAWVRAKEHSND